MPVSLCSLSLALNRNSILAVDLCHLKNTQEKETAVGDLLFETVRKTRRMLASHSSFFSFCFYNICRKFPDTTGGKDTVARGCLGKILRKANVEAKRDVCDKLEPGSKQELMTGRFCYFSSKVVLICKVGHWQQLLFNQPHFLNWRVYF